MRCGGCWAAAEFAHDEARYGRLVHHFLARHEHCGGAVEIAPGPGPLRAEAAAGWVDSC
jgi:hypothetical protein